MNELESRILAAIALTRIERDLPAAVLRAISEAGYGIVRLDVLDDYVEVAAKAGVALSAYARRIGQPGDPDGLARDAPAGEG